LYKTQTVLAEEAFIGFARDTESKFCIFYDTSYLEDDNYEKRKEVAKRLKINYQNILLKARLSNSNS
jgi:hypothetical protein